MITSTPNGQAGVPEEPMLTLSPCQTQFSCRLVRLPPRKPRKPQNKPRLTMPLLPPSERWPAWVNRLLLTAVRTSNRTPRRSTGRAAEQGPRRAAARRTADGHPPGLQPPILNQSLSLNLSQNLNQSRSLSRT